MFCNYAKQGKNFILQGAKMINGAIIGNLGRDAETFITEKNSGCRFSVAVSSGWGEKKKTNWVNVTYFGDRGVKLSEYLKKGTQVQVVGEFELNEYESKDGELKTNIRGVADRILLLSKKSENKEERELQTTYSKPKTDNSQIGIEDKVQEFEDDDIPF